jgi:membrane protein
MTAGRARWKERFADLRRQRQGFEQEQAAGRDRYHTEIRPLLVWAFPAGRARARPVRWVVIPGSLLARRIAIDDLGTHSGALTYGAILSIPPLLVFSMSILGFLLAGSPSAQKAVIDAITSLVPADLSGSATEVMQSQMSAAISGKLSFGIVGLIGLLWSASGLAARFRHALGLIFGTARVGLWASRVVGSLIGLLVVVSLVGVAVLSGIQAWADGPWSNGLLAQVGGQLLILVGQFAFVLITYRVLTPGSGPRMRDHLLGTAVFIVGFAGLVALGGIYFSYVVSKSSALYGALGSLFGAIAFLYSTAWLLLLGAEVSAFRWEVRRVPPAAPLILEG